MLVDVEHVDERIPSHRLITEDDECVFVISAASLETKVIGAADDDELLRALVHDHDNLAMSNGMRRGKFQDLLDEISEFFLAALSDGEERRAALYDAWP